MEKITDFISGVSVPATPEEVNATQPISKILLRITVILRTKSSQGRSTASSRALG